MPTPKEKVVGYDSAGAFVKALGIRALSDPEDDEGPPVEKERAAAKIFSEFMVFVYVIYIYIYHIIYV